MQFWVDLSDGFTGSSLCSIKAHNFNKMEENLTAIKSLRIFCEIENIEYLLLCMCLYSLIMPA